jgi:O-antigen/teichoic acid export membrane protein
MSSAIFCRARSPGKAGHVLADPVVSASLPSGGEPVDSAGGKDDVAALAKGGRTNFFGFLLRLVARLPFLYFAGRWYGADNLGRFAYAILVVELAAQLATLGLKRGLAQMLSNCSDDADHRNIVWDAMVLATLAAAGFALLLFALPQLMFPNSPINPLDQLLPLIVIAIVGTDIALAALAYRYDIAASVRARAIVEPWAISIAAFAFAFYSLRDGLILSYVVAMLAAWVTAMIPFLRSYGLPKAWTIKSKRLIGIARDNLPLAGADAIEWGTRRLDLAVLGLFAAPAIVGIYYVAQQVASLPQKLKTSFDPILGPVLSRSVAEGRLKDVAAQVAQVGFWVLAMQTGVALALGIPGEAIMGLAGPGFVAGTAALVLLLAAEVVASTAVTSEAALVYLAPRRNFFLSLGTIALQGALSVGLCLGVTAMGWPPMMYGVAVGIALVVALATGSLVKARLLAQLTQAPVHGWRPVLLYAASGAVVLGYGATQIPEWAELLIGVPVILGIYTWIVWTKGFGPSDRELLRLKPKKV